MRDQIERVLRTANGWTDQGHFELPGGSNVIRYSMPPLAYENLSYDLKGAFEEIDDLLGKVAPILRKAAGIIVRGMRAGVTSQDVRKSGSE